MRICLISREYPPETGWGGIATFSYHLSHGLKELGHEVEVIALAGVGSTEDKTTTDDGVVIHRVCLEKMPGIPGKVEAFIPCTSTVIVATSALWKKFLKLHKQNPFDVVDTPELLAEGLFPAITKVVPLTIRLYTPHSKFIAEGLHNITPTFDHLFVAMLERVAMLSADAITSPSRDLADYVAADLAYPKENIHIVMNPIDCNKFTTVGNKALNIDGKKIVLFVGRLEERKGVRYLVKAIPSIVKKNTDVHFVLLGADTDTAAGNKSVRAELLELLKASGCEQYVTFMERVLLEELPAYYRSASVSVVPSVYDNSPYTCLEAMSCGRAIVGTASGGTREYVEDGLSGIIVPSKDPEALASAITKFLNDEKYRIQMGENARKRALKYFDRLEIAQQTVRIYDLARENFKVRHNSLYLKDPDNVLPDVKTFLDSYNLMLNEMLSLHK